MALKGGGKTRSRHFKSSETSVGKMVPQNAATARWTRGILRGARPGCVGAPSGEGAGRKGRPAREKVRGGGNGLKGGRPRARTS